MIAACWLEDVPADGEGPVAVAQTWLEKWVAGIWIWVVDEVVAMI